MHRFFFTDVEFHPGQLIDLSPLAHQLHHVLRLTPEKQIVLLDNRGGEFVTELTAVGSRRAAGRIVEERLAQGEPAIHLTLCQCSLKADKFEWILQKGTELGVCAFTPVVSERSVVRPVAALLGKYDRWRQILREAAEQSGRGRIPRLNAPLEWSEAVRTATGVRLLAWESQPEAAHSLDLLPLDHCETISLAVGPEGGLSPDEVGQAQSAGWNAISLGQRILRAETAALAAAAAIMARCGELGDL